MAREQAAQAETTSVALFSQKDVSAPPAFLQQEAPRGNEAVTGDDLAMPRIKLMQPLNPEVNADIQPGMFLNTISNRAVTKFYAINLHFQKEFAVYKKRDLGGGWVASFPTETEAYEGIRALPGTAADYEVNESHRHVLCILDEQGQPRETVAMFFANKTGLYASREWNTEIQTIGNGKIDRFASVWEISSERQQNPKGVFYVPVKKFAAWASEELYAQAKRAYEGIAAA